MGYNSFEEAFGFKNNTQQAPLGVTNNSFEEAFGLKAKQTYEKPIGPEQMKPLSERSTLEAQRKKIQYQVSSLSIKPGKRSSEDKAIQTEYQELVRRIAEIDASESLAKTERKRSYFEAIQNNKDFSQLSQTGRANIENPVEKAIAKRIKLESKPTLSATGQSEFDRSLANMTEQERNIYGYYFSKLGKKKADEYLKILKETLLQREGSRVAEAIGTEPISTTLLGAFSGLQSTVTGTKQFASRLSGSQDVVPKGVAEYAAEEIRPELKGAQSVAFDITQNIAAMAPSILLSAATGVPLLGVTSLGVSSSGNAYAQARREGKSDAQSAAYGIMVGVSESALQYALGGIGDLGSGGISKIVSKSKIAQTAIKNIDDVLKSVSSSPVLEKALRVGASAGKYALRMGDEALEEYIQAALEPIIRNVAFDENNEIKLFDKDYMYDAMMGAVIAGVFNIGTPIGAVSQKISDKTRANQIKTAEQNLITATDNLVKEGFSPTAETKQEVAKAKAEYDRLTTGLIEGKIPTEAPVAEVTKEIKQPEALAPITKVSKEVITNKIISDMENVSAESSKIALPKNATRTTIVTGRTLNIAPQVINSIADISEKFGVRVDFVEGGTNINGSYKDGVIYINKNSETPVFDTFKHELTHHLENSKAYNDFQNYALDSDVFSETVGKDGKTIAEYRQEIINTYAEKGIVLDRMGADAEIVSDFVGKYLFTGDAQIQRLAKANPSLFEKIHQWISDTSVKLKGTPQENALLQMEQLYKDASGGIKIVPPKLTKPAPKIIPKTPINKKPVLKKPTDVSNIAKVSAKSEKVKETGVLKSFYKDFKLKITDSGAEIAEICKINGNDTPYILFNNAKQASRSGEAMLNLEQTNIKGERVGKSLADIFEPTRKKGDDYYNSFQEFLFHMHNIDRMAQDKEVFGKDVTAEMSAEIANDFLKKFPEFEAHANEVWQYNKNLQQYRVDSELISEESANEMDEMYRHYVGTFRKKPGTSGAVVMGTGIKVSKTIQKATGSSRDLLPLHETMARQTMRTVGAAKKNILSKAIYEAATNNPSELGGIVQSIEKSGNKFDIDQEFDESLKNTVTFYLDGEPVTMKINDALFEGLEGLSYSQGTKSPILRTSKKFMNNFKRLVTSFSPIFLIRNVTRDPQDAQLNTKYPLLFIKNFAIAYKEISSNSPLWRQYQSLGGFGSSFFDYDIGYKKESGFIQRNTIDLIEKGNFITEQAPRFAEFLSTIQKKGTSYEALMEAMYNAAEVTVNFGRSGTWGKTLNSTFVAFFNPSVQGSSKLIRLFTQAKGAKQITQLIIKASIVGILPSVFNYLMYQDDEEYKKISNRDKDNNFLIKMGDNQWWKIPKGRLVSFLGNAAVRTIRQIKGEEDAWAGFLSTAGENVAPINPFTSHIYAPIIGASINRTWYGSKIESERLKSLPAGERYDESTDYFSKWIGGVLGLSPKKINYLLDSYTGVIGDFILPLLTPKAEQNPFMKAFVLDTNRSNRISDDFYNKITETLEKTNSSKISDIERQKIKIELRFLNKQREASSNLYEEIRNINNSNESDKFKKEEIKEILTTISAIQMNALSTLPQLQEAIEGNYFNPNYEEIVEGKKIEPDRAEEKARDKIFLYSNREAFGSEYAIREYNKDIYFKAVFSNLSWDNYFDAYFSVKDLKSDKDNKGNPIANSLKDKRYKELIRIGLSPRDAQSFLTHQYGYKY